MQYIRWVVYLFRYQGFHWSNFALHRLKSTRHIPGAHHKVTKPQSRFDYLQENRTINTKIHTQPL